MHWNGITSCITCHRLWDMKKSNQIEMKITSLYVHIVLGSIQLNFWACRSSGAECKSGLHHDVLGFLNNNHPRKQCWAVTSGPEDVPCCAYWELLGFICELQLWFRILVVRILRYDLMIWLWKKFLFRCSLLLNIKLIVEVMLTANKENICYISSYCFSHNVPLIHVLFVITVTWLANMFFFDLVNSFTSKTLHFKVIVCLD